MLDELPNEMLLKVLAKCRNGETLVEVSQWNGRYKQLVERNKLLELCPKSAEIVLTSSGATFKAVFFTTMKGMTTIKQSYHVGYKDLPSDRADIISHFLKKFRGVTSIEIRSNDNTPIKLTSQFVNYWISLNIGVRKFNISNPMFDCNMAEFVSLCTMFKECTLENPMQTGYICDESIRKIAPHTQLNVRVGGGWAMNMSDKALKDMLDGQLPQRFELTTRRTNFTICGIRNFVEELMEKKRTLAVFDFGLLEVEESDNVLEWFNFVQENQATLSYTMSNSYGKRYRISNSYDTDQQRCTVTFQISTN